MKNRRIALINKYLDGKLTPEADKELTELMKSGGIEKEELHEFKEIIDNTSQIKIPDFEINESFLNNYRQIKKNSGYHLSYGVKRIVKIAAILILGVSFGVIMTYTKFNNNDQYVEIETKKGDKIHLTIPGKNEVWLNARSSIRYAASFTGTSRVIDLTGEAYFRFSDIENSPLIISCGDTKIICTQGSINVENDTVQHLVEIEVEKGWVAVTNPRLDDRQFIVESGFKGTINNLIPIWIEQNKNPNYLAWHTGIMKFKNTTMQDVAKTLSEVYDVDINVKGEMKYCFLNKDFNNNSLESILNEIKRTLKVNIKQQNNVITITGNPC